MSCADITYIPVQGGFLYLVAIMDWASRRVLAWRLSNTLDTEFCLAALAEALEMYGIPEIFNTDQGSQFTSIAFTEMLEAAGIRCSMDGRGRCLDGGAEARGWRALARLGEHGEDAQLSVGEQQLRRQVRQLPPEPDPAGFMGQGQRYGARELRDKRARARIAIRIDRVQEGNTTMCDRTRHSVAPSRSCTGTPCGCAIRCGELSTICTGSSPIEPPTSFTATCFEWILG